MSGKTIVTGISVWIAAKSLLNLILGFSFGNLITLVVAVVLAILLMANVPYMNYVLAVLLGIVVLKNLPYNIMNFQLIYLLEGLIDVVCVVLLVAVKDVRELFAR
ncbi:MAG: hypothetical protein ACI4F4_10495 [Lachnospiraceae bacterium]